jgi:hypothetical protein
MSALAARWRVALAALSLLGAMAAAPALADIPAPSNLRPVQTQRDCAFVTLAASAACDAAVRNGSLQLLWDEASTKVDGYKLYRVDAHHHAVVFRTANGVAPAFALIPAPRDGYMGKCYAVTAYSGSAESSPSPEYCVARGAIAYVRTLGPDRLASLIHWSVPTLYTKCKGEEPSGILAPAQIFGMTQALGFTTFLPWLTSFRNGQLVGATRQLNVAFVGIQAYGLVTNVNAGFVSGCPNGNNSLAGYAVVTARTGIDFDLRRLAGHKIYAARLTFTASQALRNDGNRYFAANDYSCATSLAVANDAWWREGDMPFHKDAQATFGLAPVPSLTLDVTPVIAGWASTFDRDDYGFVLRSRLEDGTPVQNYSCMTEYTNPRMDLVFF